MELDVPRDVYIYLYICRYMNIHNLIIFLLLIQKNKENLCTTLAYSYKESDFALTDCRHPEGPATGQHDQGSVNVKMAVPWGMDVCLL